MDEAHSSHPTDLGRLPKGCEPSQSGPGGQAGQLNRADVQTPNPQGSIKVSRMSPREKSREGGGNPLTSSLGRLGTVEWQ